MAKNEGELRGTMSTMFLIGEISKLFQIDIRTLRYYESIHLFEPASVDETTGYRYYSIDQFERLNTILYLKELNIPFIEIKLFLDNRNVDHILTLLKEQKRRTEKKITEFKQIQQRINKRIQQIEDVSNVEELFKIRVTQLPERMIVMLKQKIDRSDNLEMSIRMLEKNSNMKSTIFLGQVGLAISVTNLQQKKFDEYDALFLFVELDKHLYSNATIKSLPQQRYLRAIFWQMTHSKSLILIMDLHRIPPNSLLRFKYRLNNS
ncbi:MerR family transcriptional regulator [Paenibacillus jamilae]|uniref:MerR family transcriptional regulator n=1 Tax=Paenibacillus jamilae TaxID=114136 RepID=UPI0009C037BA|nr:MULTISPECIES: MerR family transcriptional regulator [Paenibacillus]